MRRLAVTAWVFGISVARTGVESATQDRFQLDDRLGLIGIPKTGTRSVELFLERHTPLRIPQGSPGGCIYGMTGTLDPAVYPRSTATLQPEPAAAGETRANPDLYLFHANHAELLADWRAHSDAYNLTSSPKFAFNSGTRRPICFTTTVLRDPFDRFASEFNFGLQFQLRDDWSTPAAWRRQFWGQKDYTDAELQSLQTVPPEFNGSRLDFFASVPTVAAHNRQTRFLAGISDPSVRVTREILERAKRNLKSIDVVGVLDNLRDYFSDLACLLAPTLQSSALPQGVSPFDASSPTIRDNLSRQSADTKTARFREFVYRYSWADFELVAFAKQLASEQHQRFQHCAT